MGKHKKSTISQPKYIVKIRYADIDFLLKLYREKKHEDFKHHLEKLLEKNKSVLKRTEGSEKLGMFIGDNIPDDKFLDYITNQVKNTDVQKYIVKGYYSRSPYRETIQKTETTSYTTDMAGGIEIETESSSERIYTPDLGSYFKDLLKNQSIPSEKTIKRVQEAFFSLPTKKMHGLVDNEDRLEAVFSIARFFKLRDGSFDNYERQIVETYFINAIDPKTGNSFNDATKELIRSIIRGSGQEKNFAELLGVNSNYEKTRRYFYGISSFQKMMMIYAGEHTLSNDIFKKNHKYLESIKIPEAAKYYSLGKSLQEIYKDDTFKQLLEDEALQKRIIENLPKEVRERLNKLKDKSYLIYLFVFAFIFSSVKKYLEKKSPSVAAVGSILLALPLIKEFDKVLSKGIIGVLNAKNANTIEEIIIASNDITASIADSINGLATGLTIALGRIGGRTVAKATGVKIDMAAASNRIKKHIKPNGESKVSVRKKVANIPLLTAEKDSRITTSSSKYILEKAEGKPPKTELNLGVFYEGRISFKTRETEYCLVSFDVKLFKFTFHFFNHSNKPVGQIATNQDGVILESTVPIINKEVQQVMQDIENTKMPNLSADAKTVIKKIVRNNTPTPKMDIKPKVNMQVSGAKKGKKAS